MLFSVLFSWDASRLICKIFPSLAKAVRTTWFWQVIINLSIFLPQGLQGNKRPLFGLGVNFIPLDKERKGRKFISHLPGKSCQNQLRLDIFCASRGNHHLDCAVLCIKLIDQRL